MAQHSQYRLPMSPTNLEALRHLCRDQEAFLQLKQFLEEREILYQQFSTQIAQQMQKNQELEAQQQAAEVASQAKSQFLAMMSHELRTPLNSILGLSTVLSQQVIGDLNSKQLEYLDCIRESGEHLLALISDILDLSKVEAGQEQLVLTDVAVVPLCQSCIAMVEPRAIAKGLTLSCQVEPGAESCVADDRRLRQMLLNLLSNAVKFTHIGHISLTVQPQGAMLQFAVEDTGIGIPDERRDQLFQPFTQLDSDLNRHYEGTGLGLALTQQLAQLHGGYLTVESEVERGSRFLLYLPLAPRPSQALSASGYRTSLEPRPSLASPSARVPGWRSPACFSPRSSVSLPQTLLLLDATPDPHQVVITYMQTCGWQVVFVQSWAEVQTQAAQHLPRLLVVGRLDSETADQLLALRRQPHAQALKIIAILQESDPEYWVVPEVDAYLTLPLTIPKLERMLTL